MRPGRAVQSGYETGETDKTREPGAPGRSTRIVPGKISRGVRKAGADDPQIAGPSAVISSSGVPKAIVGHFGRHDEARNGVIAHAPGLGSMPGGRAKLNGNIPAHISAR